MKRFMLVLTVLALSAFTGTALADGGPPVTVGPAPPPATIGPPPPGPISSSEPGSASGLKVPDCVTRSVSWRTLPNSHGLAVRFSSLEQCGSSPKLTSDQPMTMRLQRIGQPIYVSYPGCADFTVTTPKGEHACP